jgi:hypothetical protein
MLIVGRVVRLEVDEKFLDRITSTARLPAGPGKKFLREDGGIGIPGGFRYIHRTFQLDK